MFLASYVRESPVKKLALLPTEILKAMESRVISSETQIQSIIGGRPPLVISLCACTMYLRQLLNLTYRHML